MCSLSLSTHHSLFLGGEREAGGRGATNYLAVTHCFLLFFCRFLLSSCCPRPFASPRHVVPPLPGGGRSSGRGCGGRRRGRRALRRRGGAGSAPAYGPGAQGPSPLGLHAQAGPVARAHRHTLTLTRIPTGHTSPGRSTRPCPTAGPLTAPRCPACAGDVPEPAVDLRRVARPHHLPLRHRGHQGPFAPRPRTPLPAAHPRRARPRARQTKDGARDCCCRLEVPGRKEAGVVGVEWGWGGRRHVSSQPR